MLRTVRPARGHLGAVLMGIILACSDGEGTASLGLEPAGPPASLSATPADLTLIAGDSLRLTTTIRDARGRPVAAHVAWSSADPAVAVVTGEGLVTAMSDGATTVSVSVGSLSATVPIAVIEVHGAIAFSQRILGSNGKTRFDAVAYAGRVVRPLPRPSQLASIAAPAWSPDGAMLAVEVVRDVTEAVGEDGLHYSSDLYVFPANAPDSGVRALAVGGNNNSPNWSPDGSRILYVHTPIGSGENHIEVVGIAGGAPTRLTSRPGAYGAPRWSPDGARIAFADGSVGNGDVFIMNADGSGVTNVTRSPEYDGDPDWSPDGTRLILVSERGGAGRRMLVADAIRGTLQPLLTTGYWASGPTWSPDGRYIAFAATSAQHGLAIYVMRPDGSHTVQLTHPALGNVDANPAWRR